MLGKINQIMEDKIVDDSFDSTFFKSINEYVEQEQSSMDERLTVNDEGEVVLEDSLDDTMNDKADKKYRYTVDEAFVDHDDNDIIENLNKQLKPEDVDSAIRRIIQTSTLQEKSIIDLYIVHSLSIVEISEVTKIESKNVQIVISQLQRNIVQLTGDN
ncbi:MAG: DNA-directed RNA polymerase specialized sigma24 family protein [Saprospiraceae bacterium]|jgi:DNA-directed RNA polymerase specialized sigma24 family protein